MVTSWQFQVSLCSWKFFFCIMVSVCLIDRLHSQGDGRLLFRRIKGSSKVNRCHRSCVCVTPHPCPRVGLEKDWGKNVLVILGPHLDKEGQLIVVTNERGLPSKFRETTRNRSCKYIARKKEASLIFPVPELLAETCQGKEHSLSYLYQGEEAPQ